MDLRDLWPDALGFDRGRLALSRAWRGARSGKGAWSARRCYGRAGLDDLGWSTEGVVEREAEQLNLNLEDRRLRLTLELAKQLIGTPRHLSQHPGGFVLTLDRLDELVPVEPAAMDRRQVIEWDKDDIDALKFMKVDVQFAIGRDVVVKTQKIEDTAIRAARVRPKQLPSRKS